MPSRISTFSMRPWPGGLNTSLDAALIPPDELTRAENIVFDTSGSRKSRDGLSLWDYIATGVQAGSSGTTRTLVLSVNSGFTLAVNDQISVKSASGIDTDYDIKLASIVSVDSITYSPNIAITYEMTASLTESLAANTDIRVGRWEIGDRIIGVYDYWRYSSGSKLQKIVAVSSAGNFYEYDINGSKSLIGTSGLSLTTPLSKCSFATLAEKLVIAFDGNNNSPVIWSGTGNIEHITNTDWEGNDIQSTNPTPSLENLRIHNQRIYATVSDQPDRIYYSDINNPERWNGEGDSGAIEVATGDGDSSGFSAIFPSFKGQLGAAKGNRLYKIAGYAPLQSAQLISEGIGSESHDACVAIDQDDVLFISRRGVHSFSATDAYGDFQGAFLSSKIQKEFNELNRSKVASFKGVYMPNINSVAFIMEEQGQTSNNVVYLLNIEGKQWYKWTQSDGKFQVDSIATYENSKNKQMLMGLVDGRILRYDSTFDTDFVNEDVRYRIDTGIIYPDNDPSKLKGFKEVGVLYKTERDSVDFNLTVKIDDYSPQEINITQTPEGDALGTQFYLGTSSLGFTQILLPYNQSIDGYGFGIVISLTSTEPLEIYGYTLDFEPAGDQRDVDR